MDARTTLQPGERLGPYQIVAFVAAGGMGEVYKARDTRLDRLVAVKRLTARHSDRFQSEARAIAALNHPHICQVYDVGPDYLVMEYLDGQTLAERLGWSKDRPLQANEALAIAIQMADAVDAAHQRGILHRDLKPANIMVTAVGGAKLLDFGLARLVADDADLTRTAAGTVLGTPAYMSPEQTEGRALDVRSDIFSFGAVLYELLAGRRAFDGPTMAQIISAVLRDEPRPLRTELPHLDGVVHRCLAKDPGKRFQTMAEVKTALEQTALEGAAKRAEPQPSIAVLPFADMSASQDQEWFSDGLAEEIINALARVPGLKVIARTSAFAFKGKNQDIRRIAETLGVANILEGSVRRAGDRVRITAQLIAAADGGHLWSERYDRDMTDVFAIQEDIAHRIATVLEVKLSTGSAVGRHHTPNLHSYEAVLKGRHYWARFTPESLARVREYAEQAISLDPGYAEPHVLLGAYFHMLAHLGVMPAREAMPLARKALQRALHADPGLPDAYAHLATVAILYDYDWNEAERLIELATAQGSATPIVRASHGQYLTRVGRLDDGIRELERAVAEDPLNIVFRNMLALNLSAAGRHEQSDRELREILELDQNTWFVLSEIAMDYASRGMASEALTFVEKAHALAPWDVVASGVLAGLLVRTGDRNRADALVRQLTASPAHLAPVGLLFFHLVCGEIEQAADSAEKAIEQRHPGILGFLRFPLANALRSSARWPALARMMNLPEGVA